jgi:hypothetical protein
VVFKVLRQLSWGLPTGEAHRAMISAYGSHHPIRGPSELEQCGIHLDLAVVVLYPLEKGPDRLVAGQQAGRSSLSPFRFTRFESQAR